LIDGLSQVRQEGKRTTPCEQAVDAVLRQTQQDRVLAAARRRCCRLIVVATPGQLEACGACKVFDKNSRCQWRSQIFGTVVLLWRRGSVVRTSVFNWRTFPDLRLIYG